MGKEGEKRKHDDANNNRSPGSDYEEEKKKRKLERKLEKLNKKLQKREGTEGEKNVSTPSSSSSSSATTSEATPSTNSSIETLTMNDYYRKYQEFRLWLLNNKKLRIEDDLDSTEEIQHYFKKFIKKWNSGKLSSKYYSKTGVHSSELSHQQRTTYNWNLKNVSHDEELKLELTRDRVDTNTFEKNWKEESQDKN